MTWRVNIRNAAVYDVFGETARVRLPAIGGEIIDIAKADVAANHFRTGVLAGSFEAQYHWSPVFPSVTVHNRAPYARAVHEGTGAHPIIGNPLLVFRWAERGGRLFRGRMVNHPGYGGDPFLRNAMFAVVGR